MVKPIPYKRKQAAYEKRWHAWRRAWRAAAGHPPDEHDLRPEPATLDTYDDEEG